MAAQSVTECPPRTPRECRPWQVPVGKTREVEPHRPKPLALTWRRKAGGARTRGHVASSRAPATLVSQSEPRTPPPSLAEARRDHPKCTTDSSPLPREVSLNFFQRKRVCCVSWASVRPWTESWRLSLPAACRPLGPHGSTSSPHGTHG